VVSPTVYILIGPPGVGKSTWRAQHLKLNPETYTVSSDDLIEELAAIAGKTYNEMFHIADKKIVEPTIHTLFRSAIQERKDIIVDRTNMTLKGRRRFLSNTTKEYRKVAVVFSLPREELDRRLEARESKTGKHIPPHVIDQMMASYIVPTLDEFDEILVVENEIGGME
jgi:predicted kinase